MIRDPKTFCFNFDFSKDLNENLKNEIEFIIKSNESIAEKKRTNIIEPFFLKYKHESNIHKHRKQQKKSTT